MLTDFPNIIKEGPYWKVRVNEFNDLQKIFDHETVPADEWVFRGQAETSWGLQTTLDRLIYHARQTGVKGRGVTVHQFVQKHIGNFKKNILGRRGDHPPKLNEDEMWSLGQHYGLATPLLDWSESPYIAMFFALGMLKEQDTDRAIWCLNRRLVEKVNGSMNEKKNHLRIFLPDTEDNNRLLQQSGLFTKGPVLLNVEDWVSRNGDLIYEMHHQNVPVVLRLDFPGNTDMRNEMLRRLNLMNINHSTLFPDLIGAAQHCNILAEGYMVNG
jgi:hypothetical protein